ncbi:MAG TPA: cytochrome c [Myxococcus sp.]|nr:cytochrome c [Myxococcus sp.]
MAQSNGPGLLRGGFPRRLLLLLALLLPPGLVLTAHASEPARTKASAKKPQPHKVAPVLPAPDYLPPEARAALRKKMERHGQAMADLTLSVTLLQYDVASDVAGRIANAPRISRPEAGGEDELSTLLPERFFTLQDEARSRAQAVQAAAQKRDDAALAQSYGRLTETCVTCHAAYLSHRK